MRLAFALLTALLSTTACAGASSSAGSSTAHGKDCAGVGTSTLPGACIDFAGDGGSWTVAQAAAGIDIPYTLVVETDIAGVVPRPQDAGRCGSPELGGLILFERILDGDETRWCMCDTGLCPSGPNEARTLTTGRSQGSFRWNGVEWQGPSDTNNPQGPPLAPGVYTLEISAVGTVEGRPFEVRNRFTITLTKH
ncbi:MAG: hypothetical protein KC457_16845 [Myxococcales bacterium]|nr:hypothetical protein [Myxococcales bacterium]